MYPLAMPHTGKWPRNHLLSLIAQLIKHKAGNRGLPVPLLPPRAQGALRHGVTTQGHSYLPRTPDQSFWGAEMACLVPV